MGAESGWAHKFKKSVLSPNIKPLSILKSFCSYRKDTHESLWKPRNSPQRGWKLPTSCDSERTFSMLSILKTCFLSTMLMGRSTIHCLLIPDVENEEMGKEQASIPGCQENNYIQAAQTTMKMLYFLWILWHFKSYCFLNRGLVTLILHLCLE